jgi:hypothetical protein
VGWGGGNARKKTGGRAGEGGEGGGPAAMDRNVATLINRGLERRQRVCVRVLHFCLLSLTKTPAPIAIAKASWPAPWLSCGRSARGAAPLHDACACDMAHQDARC